MRPSGEQLVTAFLAAVITWLAASTTLGSNGLTQLAELKRARAALTAEVVDTGNRIAELEEARARLAGDQAYLEQVAREELGLVYPDEVVYRFRPAPVPAP